MTTTDGGPQIAPIACFGDCDAVSVVVINLVGVTTLVLGALLMQRWRDLPLVAFVASLSMLVASHARDIAVAGKALPLETFGYADPMFWREIGFAYFMFLLIAFAVHAGKRAVIWWFSRRRFVPDA